MDILETLGLSGENIPQEYRRGTPKEVVRAKEEQEAKIKNDNDLEHQLAIANQEKNALLLTNKQKDEKIKSLENTLATKDFKEATLINSIFPQIKKIEESVEIFNKKFDMLEDMFDGKLYAVLAKNDVLENKIDAIHATVRTIPAETITEISKISTTQTTQIVSEIEKLPDSDEIDAIVRTQLSETADVINSKIVSEAVKIKESIINIPKPIDLLPMLENTKTLVAKNDDVISELWKIHESVTNLPKPVDVSPALENIKNGLFAGFQYICKGDEGIVEPI